MVSRLAELSCHYFCWTDGIAHETLLSFPWSYTFRLNATYWAFRKHEHPWLVPEYAVTPHVNVCVSGICVCICRPFPCTSPICSRLVAAHCQRRCLAAVPSAGVRLESVEINRQNMSSLRCNSRGEIPALRFQGVQYLLLSIQGTFCYMSGTCKCSSYHQLLRLKYLFAV